LFHIFTWLSLSIKMIASTEFCTTEEMNSSCTLTCRFRELALRLW